MSNAETFGHVSHRIPCALLALVVLAIGSLQETVFCADAAWGATEIPNPQGGDRDRCGRGGKKSAVCDPDGFISPSDADTIDGLINFIHDGSHGFHQYPCPGGTPGAQIAVAIVSRMKRSFGDNSDKPKRALSFAKTLHDRWGVGDRTCQNGAVLFFAISDRAMGFSIGAGLKSVVTDDHVSAIMSIIGDDLRHEKYGQAVVKAVTDIGNILSGNVPREVQHYREGNGGGFGFGIFALAVAGIIGVSSVKQIRSRQRYKRCKQVLKTIDRDRARANRQEYVATSCPICLEDFSNDAQSVARARSTSTLHEENQSPARDTVIELAPLQTSTHGSQQAADDSSDQQVVTLVCGHKFHRSCVLQWADSGSGSGRNATCPVCRRPIVNEGEGNLRNGLARENAGSRRSTAGWDLYDDEYNFRLRRAHYFYPDFVTWTMIDDWSRHRRDESQSLASSNAFSAVDPVVVAREARHAGASGTSFSFGGGSSVGGGGGGGSW